MMVNLVSSSQAVWGEGETMVEEWVVVIPAVLRLECEVCLLFWVELLKCCSKVMKLLSKV